MTEPDHERHVHVARMRARHEDSTYYDDALYGGLNYEPPLSPYCGYTVFGQAAFEHIRRCTLLRDHDGDHDLQPVTSTEDFR